MSKLFIRTYGCQMNVYDSARMADALAGTHVVTSDPGEADLIIVNTCHIREKAAEKLYSELGRLKKIREARARAGKPTMIGVAGCVAQAEGAEIIARAPSVDLVFGPQTYHELPALLARAESGPVIAADFAAEEKFARLPSPAGRAAIARAPSAFLTIQEGCDKFCTFCVVPYTRGAEFSRPRAQILDEANELAQAGVREITVLGQNVNAWHGTDRAGRPIGLGELLRELAGIAGIERLRYTTSHPRDVDDSLIAAHRDLEKLMPYLHLPVQSGADPVLVRMNRRHTAAEYLATVGRIRAARPDIALSGDFIVGFPGETDADFAATLAIVDEVRYASAFSFKYSPRPGTPGAEMGDQVPEPLKAERLAELQARIEAHRSAFNAALEGRVVPVLFEKPGRRAGQLAGRSPWLQTVLAEGGLQMLGTIADVRIARAAPNSLFGDIVTQPAAAQ